MRSIIAISVAACAAMVHTSSAFTCPSASLAASPRVPASQRRVAGAGSAVFMSSGARGDEELVPSLQFMNKEVEASAPSRGEKSVRQRLRRAGLKAWERMDTLRAAGLCDDEDGGGLVPMHSGFKRNVGLLVAAFLWKWYRARFINKIPVTDRQPQW